MTGASASLVRDVDRRAQGDASLAVALVALALVPLPALLASARAGAGLAQPHAASVARTLSTLAASTPLFALMPFVLGCGIGTLLHLVVTAPERFAIMRDEREAHISARSLVAMSLLVGAAFAATGLLAGIALF